MFQTLFQSITLSWVNTIPLVVLVAVSVLARIIDPSRKVKE